MGARSIFKKTHIQKISGVKVTKTGTNYDKRGSTRNLHSDFLDTGYIHVRKALYSISNSEGTVRGLHIQRSPHEENKLVTCLVGAVFDVVLDLRPDSESFMCYSSLVLEAGEATGLFLPRGLAHGFQTLEPNTSVLYLIDREYDSRNLVSINPFDPELNISWPKEVSVVSERDLTGISSRDFMERYCGT